VTRPKARESAGSDAGCSMFVAYCVVRDACCVFGIADLSAEVLTKAELSNVDFADGG